MTGYRARLAAREQQTGRPVRVGLVGAGQMGTGLVAQIERIGGMQVSAIADVAVERADQAFARTGVSDVVHGDDRDTLIAAVEDGRRVAVNDIRLLSELPVDMVIEATGVPDIGAQVALAALTAGKDVGLLNVECDVTVGYLLSALAEQLGRVYTVCRGDEPAEAKRLVDFARDLAFEVVCAGKGKNNPLNVHAGPADLAAEAAAKHMNPKMLASFVDGSKAMIEMAALANATGLEMSKRGMYGPPSTVEQLSTLFRPQSEGGVLDRAGVVDYCTGSSVAPGVFVVVHSNDQTVCDEMTYLKMGDGPYFSFYRPYHLASIEAPLSIAEAAVDRTASLQPIEWKAEVLAAAKRDLAPGDRIDGIGGTTVYGMADAAAAPGDGEFVPLGLLAGVRVVRPVAIDQLVGWDDVEIDESSTIVRLRRLQDQLLRGEIDAASLPGTLASLQTA